MTFYLDGKELVVPAGDAPLFIARGHVHGLTASKYHFYITRLDPHPFQTLTYRTKSKEIE